jgi:hypothetical protein
VQGAGVLPDLQYLIVTTYNPAFAVLRYVLACKFLNLKKSKSLRLLMHIYLYFLIETVLNRLIGSIFFRQSSGVYNYFVGVCHHACGLAMLIVSYFLLKKVVERHGWFKRLYDLPESMLLAAVFAPAAILLYASMIVIPSSVPNGVIANGILFVIMLLVISNSLMYPIMMAESKRGEIKQRQIDALKSSVENFNGIKHDFYNILSTYSGFMEVENWEKLKKFHQSVTNYTLNAGICLELSKKMDRNPALITLLMHKVEYAKSQEVKMQIQLQTDVGGLGVDDIELCRMVSCLVDNAIEAAAKSKRKSVLFALTNNQNISKSITISNSTTADVDIGKISVLGVSTKEGHMGVGVNNSLKIAQNNDNCSLRFSYFEHEFTASLDIKNRHQIQLEPVYEHAYAQVDPMASTAKKLS